MAKFSGPATMFMRMSMSTTPLPVQGYCSVDGKKVTLKFPANSIAFELGGEPTAGMEDYEFKICSSSGVTLVISVHYVAALDCFTVEARREQGNTLEVYFSFYGEDSPLAQLPMPEELKR